MPTPESIRDDLLVLRCQTGEAHAFEMLVERWQLHLLNFAFRLTGNWAAAQDVVQDSWLVVIRGLVGLRDVGRFKPWLFQIASHKCADYWRRKRRATLLAEEFGKAMPVGQEPVATGQREDLATAFARLSPDHRTVLALRYLEEFPVEEIAEILALPEGTVKSRLFHARQQLKQWMEKDNGPA